MCDVIVKTRVDGEFFNVKDTLECGQVFRFKKSRKGYKVYSQDRCAYVYNEEGETILITTEEDKEYFENYFDLKRDYSQIVNDAISQGYEILTKSAIIGKGVRILKQDKLETLFSFLISQNNNIPRIKNIIEKLCIGLGEVKYFEGEEYYSFPTPQKMAQAPLEFFKSIGLGYRAEYIKRLAEQICDGLDVNDFDLLSTIQLKKELVNLYGVGPKVADCVSLFGFNRTDSFPVDTWIAKVYEQDFDGKLKDRKKIAEWFTQKFGNSSGYFQQYLFYYKRTLSKESD